MMAGPLHVKRHPELPPLRHEELPPPWITEERANEWSEDRIIQSLSWSDPRGQEMKTPDDVAEMLRLKACGWGVKRIARQLGCSHPTVRGYAAADGVKPFKSPGALPEAELTM